MLPKVAGPASATPLPPLAEMTFRPDAVGLSGWPKIPIGGVAPPTVPRTGPTSSTPSPSLPTAPVAVALVPMKLPMTMRFVMSGNASA